MKRIIKIICIIIMAIMVVSTGPFVIWSSAQDYVAKDIFKNADPSTHVFLVHTKLVTNTAGSEIPTIEKLVIQQSKINVLRSKTVEGIKEDEYLIEVLNQDGKQVFSMNFQYPKIMTVPPLPIGMITNEEPNQIWIKEPEVTLVIPYLHEASFVRILSQGRSAVTSMSIEKALLIDTHEEKPSPIPAEQGKFHILIMASGYTLSEMPDFNIQAQNIKNNLSSMEPFNSYSSKTEMHIYDNMNNLGCYCGCFNIDRLMCCNQNSIISAAVGSGYFFDEIIIIHNTAAYCGGGYRDYGSYQNNSYNSYAMVYDGSWSSAMAKHEFGHSFGNLCDEYTYGSEDYDYYDCVNCKSTCDGWIYLTDVCTLGCDARPSYFRPDDSIMLDLGIDSYNSVSIHHSLIPRLQYFFSQATHILTVTKNGTGSGTVTSNPAGINSGDDCSETYDAGEVVILNALADRCSNFVSWTDCDNPVGDECTMTMNADKTVTAIFDLSTFTVGDVDCDGNIDIVDALFIARFSAGLSVPPEFNQSAADTNCDTSVNIIDALLVARYAAGQSMDGTGWCGL